MDQGTQPQQDADDTVDLGALIAAAQKNAAVLEGLVETGRQRLASIQEATSSASSALEGIQAKVQEVAGIATQAVAAKTQITDEQAVIATKSDHIQNAQAHADKVRGELDRTQTTTAQHATEIEGHRTRAQTAADGAADLLSTMHGHKTTAEAELSAVVAARDSAKDSAEKIRALADKAETIEKRVAAYEARLKELDEQCSTQLQEIVKLLPGATAAGLAHSFDQRRQTFLKPATRWQWLFVGSVGALVILALTGLWGALKNGAPLSYDDLVRLWLARLPIAGALVWLALHASRESALAKRLEEDYGYKAAIAASFQGFQKQMAEIASGTPAGGPLSKLCEDTLATIANPPGRIYDKHQLTVSPTSELAAAASKVTGNEKPDAKK